MLARLLGLTAVSLAAAVGAALGAATMAGAVIDRTRERTEALRSWDDTPVPHRHLERAA